MEPQYSAPGSSTGATLLSTPFHRVFVYISSVKSYSKPLAAWLSVSSSVRWIYIKEGKTQPPQQFLSFRKHYCLSLNRLSHLVEWNDVERSVHGVPAQNGYGLVVPGVVSKRNKVLFRAQPVQVTFVADSEHLRDAWVNLMQCKIAPWSLLNRRMRNEILNAGLNHEDLRNLLSTAQVNSKSENLTAPTDEDDKDKVEIGGEADGALNEVGVLTNFVETVAMAVQMSAPAIKESAELVGNVAKCVSVVGSAFQVATLCMTIIEMAAEVKRGTDVLPQIRARADRLQKAIVDSMIPILHPDGQVDELRIESMFKAQEEVSNTLTSIETQMMRRRAIQFLKASELKTIESEIERLEQIAISVSQSGKIAQNTSTLVYHGNTLVNHGNTLVNHGNTLVKHGNKLVNHENMLVGHENVIVEHDNKLARFRSAMSRQRNTAARLTADMADIRREIEEDYVPVLRERPKLTPYFVGRVTGPRS